MSSPGNISGENKAGGGSANGGDKPPVKQKAAKKLGAYILLKKKIGSGSYADVYKGYHRKDLTPVAIKVISRSKLNDKLMSALEFEISTLKKLSHDHIIKLYDVHKSTRHYYLVMEYADKGDLTNYIKKRGGKLHEEEARRLLFDLALGLQAIQKLNLVHRDLKPQNLLLLSKDSSDEDILKIADFGFAREILPNDLAQTMCGSPLYMAPEIIKNKKYNYKADLWSVGTILYEMLTGRQPFLAQNIMQLMTMINSEPIKYPDYLSPEVVDLLKGLLQRNPEKRIDFETFLNHPFLKREEMRRKKEQEKAGEEAQQTAGQEELHKDETDAPKESAAAGPVEHSQDDTASRMPVTYHEVDPVADGEEPSVTGTAHARSATCTSVSHPRHSASLLKKTNINPFLGENLHDSVIVDKTVESDSKPPKHAQKQAMEDFNLEDTERPHGRTVPCLQTLESCFKISDLGDVQFLRHIPAASEDSGDQFDAVVKLEKLLQRAWVVAEAAYLNVHFKQNFEGLVLYNMALSLLFDAFQLGKAVLGSPPQAKEGDRLLEIMNRLKDLYVDIAERAATAKYSLKQELGQIGKSSNVKSHLLVRRRICPEVLLYNYGLKLAKTSSLNEFLGSADIENCKAMYRRAQIVFETLLEDEHAPSFVSASSDREVLVQYIQDFKEHIASMSASNNQMLLD